MNDRIAAIDIGTNSVRLLVAERDPNAPGRAGFRTVERLATITRLGQGVDRDRRLHRAPIERTVDVLRRYRAVMDELGTTRVRATATSAARDAENRDEFFDAVESTVGVRPELLGGDEEGRLSFVGSTWELEVSHGPFCSVDIGGGSTEFALGTDRCEGVMSIDVGCVRLTEQFLHHDPPYPEELVECLSVVDAFLEDVERELPAITDTRTWLGLAGTVTTVAAVELGLAEYDRDRIHHFRLTHAAAEDVFRTLATEKRADRIANPGLEEARADVIVAGCCVLVAIYRHFALEDMLVSEADILDGLVASLL